MHADRSAFRAVNGFARDTPWAHGFMAGYAHWGGLVALAALLIIGWLRARRRDEAPRAVATAFLVGVATLLALLASTLIAPAVGRERPCHVLSGIEVLLSCSPDPSFPSDHSTIAGAFAGGLLLLEWPLGVLAVFLALLLAFSRVYAGVHYPGDVAAGLAIGAAIGVATVLLLRRATAALASRFAETPLRVLIVARR